MSGIPMRVTLAVASIGAAVIHFVVTPDHFEEFALFGVFFLLLGVFQVLWGGSVALVPNRIVLLTGVLASAAVIGVWVVSRTAGLPLGPDPGTPEAFGVLDTLSSALEAVIVVGGTSALIKRSPRQRPAELPPWEREPRAA